jgi:hypothetical protein
VLFVEEIVDVGVEYQFVM